MKKTQKSCTKKRSTTKTFNGFAEYWHLTKTLSEYHRKLLVGSMPQAEQNCLMRDFEGGGWETLFRRNECDELLSFIKKETGVDLLSIRLKVLSDKPQLVHKYFWQFITECFDYMAWEHISYIFDGLKVENFDEDYVKIIRYKPVQ